MTATVTHVDGTDARAAGPPHSTFLRDGFVRFPSLLDPPAVAAAIAALDGLTRDDPAENPLSLGAMHFASNAYRRCPELCELLRSPQVVELVGLLLGPDTWVRWDQAVWKHPGAPAFPLHQDNGYTGLEVEHLQVWFALTDADAANGGLRVVPGGHRTPLEHRWVGHHLATTATGDEVALDATAGDVIAFSSWLPHATAPNVATTTRLAYVAEFLPLGAPDPSVPRPHFIASERGRPSGRWEA